MEKNAKYKKDSKEKDSKEKGKGNLKMKFSNEVSFVFPEICQFFEIKPDQIDFVGI